MRDILAIVLAFLIGAGAMFIRLHYGTDKEQSYTLITVEACDAE